MADEPIIQQLHMNDRQHEIQQVKVQVEGEQQIQIIESLDKSLMKMQQKGQNPKIGRPAKTDQQQQFKKCYLQNKQKFQLQCQLLVYIHQSYFSQIPDHPSNLSIPKQLLDDLFSKTYCLPLYKFLLSLNKSYSKNSTLYPKSKLKYTSLIDVAYMVFQVGKQFKKLASKDLLMVMLFYLYNQKLVNHKFYQYFVAGFHKLREGMIFGPSKMLTKLQKIDKLIICLCLTLADLEKVTIQEEITYSDQQCSQSQGQQNQNSQKQKKLDFWKRPNKINEQDILFMPEKKVHIDNIDNEQEK